MRCLFVLLAACHSMPPHRTVAFAQAPQTYVSWDDVLAHPSAVPWTAFKTGTVLAGPSILIDASNKDTPEHDKHDQWVPSFAYWLRHPTQGDLLLDTGVASAPCDYGLK